MIFALIVLCNIPLFISREKHEVSERKTSPLRSIKRLFTNKAYVRSISIFCLNSFAVTIGAAFLGTYQIKELGFSLGFVSILSIIFSLSRIIFSIPFGKIADKYSFRVLLTLCFIIDATAYLVNTFTVPENGKIFYTIYGVLAAIAMAGINSGSFNILYEYMPPEKRTGAIAFKSAISGSVGFLATLIASPLVKYVQSNGNKLFGLNVYAQQVLSAISFTVTIIIIIYLNTVIKKLPKPDFK
jgi:MFS family permease